MKRLSFFGVSIAVVIIIALGIWFMNRPASKTIPAQSAQQTSLSERGQGTPPITEVPSFLLVTPIASTVSIAPSTNVSVFQQISTPTQVVQGSHVKTDATGRALIEGINTTVLDSNTEITLAILDTQKNQSRFFLEAGQVWSRVKKLSDKGEFYEIETQNVRASVRGTSFGIKKVGNVFTVYVVEGIVNFGTIPPETDDAIRFSAANVGAGKKAVLIDGDLVPVVSDITEKDRQDPWFVYNNSVSSNLNTIKWGEGTPPIMEGIPTESISPPPGSGTSMSTEIIAPSSDTVPQGQGTQPISGGGVQPNRTITPATDTSPELLLSTVSPNSMVAGTAVTFTLAGSGFVKAGVFSVFIGNTRMTSFKVVDDSTIRLSIDAGKFPAGDYDVTVEGTSGTTSTLSPGLIVTRASATQTTTPLR